MIIQRWLFITTFLFLSFISFNAHGSKVVGNSPPTIVSTDQPPGAIPLTEGVPYSDFITFSGEVKWYAISITAPGKVTAFLQVPNVPGLNYDLQLYRLDSDANRLIQVVNSSFGPQINEQVSKIAEPGLYYAAVKSAAGFDSSNPFRISFSVSASYEGSEADDSPWQAYPMTPQTASATWIFGNFDNARDIDWLRLDLDHDIGLALSYIARNSSPADHMLEIYDDQFVKKYTIAPGQSTNTRLNQGTYYLKLSSPTQKIVSYSLGFQEVNPPVDRVATRINITDISTKPGYGGYINYGQGLKWRVKDTMSIKGNALDSTGVGVPNTEVNVEVRFILNSTVVTRTATTDAQGFFIISMAIPTAIGQYLYDNSISYHYYDIVPMTFKNNGKALSSNQSSLYHFAYSIYK